MLSELEKREYDRNYTIFEQLICDGAYSKLQTGAHGVPCRSVPASRRARRTPPADVPRSHILTDSDTSGSGVFRNGHPLRLSPEDPTTTIALRFERARQRMHLTAASQVGGVFALRGMSSINRGSAPACMQRSRRVAMRRFR